MDLELISKVVANIGLPGAILIYLIWRLDKFLTALISKLAIFNGEFKDIGFSLNNVAKELKELKDTLIANPKK